MQKFITFIKYKTRPIRIYYLIIVKLYFLRIIVFIVEFCFKSHTLKKTLIYKFDSLIIPASQKLKIYTYPYSLRMLTAKTYSYLRSSIFPYALNKNKIDYSVINDLNKNGHYNNIPLKISIEKCNKVISYFTKKPSFFSHSFSSDVILEKNDSLEKLRQENKPLPKYISYGYSDQLDCGELFKLIINPTIIELAHAYLGCIPKIQYLNTFWTLPSEDNAWLANYHRDLDDYLSLTVMVNWTNTLENNSGTSFIKGTHRPSSILSSKLINSNDKFFPKTRNYKGSSNEDIFNIFRESSYPGYGQNQRYKNIFQENKDFLSSSGNQGTISLQNNEGLHCGPMFNGQRLISWIRYGCSGGVSERIINVKGVKLKSEYKSIIQNSKYGFLIQELFD